MVKDGKEVVEFFRKEKNIQKLGIHGESLGGCIAIQIASLCGCDFLFVDRTFGSLSDTIYFRFGRFIYFLFKISKIPDIDSTTTYLKLNCYKLMTADVQDHIIKDLASLKSAVATLMIQKNTSKFRDYYKSQKWNSEYIFTQLEYKKFKNSLFNIIKFEKNNKPDEKSVNSTQVFKTQTKDDSDSNFIDKILDIFRKINACGVSLIEISKTKKNFLLKFQVWLMTLQI